MNRFGIVHCTDWFASDRKSNSRASIARIIPNEALGVDRTTLSFQAI